MSDGDYAPSVDPRADEYNGERSKSSNNSNLDPRYHHADNNNFIGDQQPYHDDWREGTDAHHEHWERNGRHYEEYNPDSSVYNQHISNSNSNLVKPTPRSRGSTPQRELLSMGTPSPSPVPPPRRNLPSTAATMYDSDARSSPYHERRGEYSPYHERCGESSPYHERRSENSEPLYYNSCRPTMDEL